VMPLRLFLFFTAVEAVMFKVLPPHTRLVADTLLTLETPLRGAHRATEYL